MKTDTMREALYEILKPIKQTHYQGVLIYLVSKSQLDAILGLELQVQNDNISRGIEKKNHFYEYAKIINPEYPAFKYTLLMKHKKKEIFDPVKVQKALPAEFEIWKNKSRVEIEKQIKDPESAITESQAQILRASLEQEIIVAQQNVTKVLEDFSSYDVVITTYEQYSYYPALYYVMEDEKGKSKASDTHLRKDVPNILWYQDERAFSDLRANDKMSRIVQTFERYCESIYIKKR